MTVFAKLSTPAIIVIMIVALIVLIGSAIVLVYFVFSRKKLAKEVKALDKKFQHLHALIISKCGNYIHRLEVISRSNLLFEDTHEVYLRLFKEVRDRHDARAQTAINNVKDLLADRNFKKLKAELPATRDIMVEFEKEVNNLNSKLIEFIKPEEDARSRCLLQKEEYRRIKAEYSLHQSELQLVSRTYEEVFKYVDKLFVQFEADIDSANYDEANNILPKIEKILHELSNYGRDLPDLVARVNTIIPDRISALEYAYDVMTQHENYPLHHLTVKVNIKKINEMLETLRGKIKVFEINGVSEQLDSISSSIEDYFLLFETEKKARAEFENDNTDIYKSVNEIERRFIKLKNTLPEVSKIFIINDEYTAKITEIQNEINKVGAVKRSLDTLVHSSAKQPYSILASKMKDLHEETDLVISHLESFRNYLDSLKVDSECAYTTMYDYFKLLKTAEKQLRDINNEDLANRYQPTIDHLFDLLSTLNDLIKVQPIDVEKVNSVVAQIHLEGDKIVGETGEIAQEANLKVMAENAIIYANRSRNNFSDVDQMIKQAEDLFNKGKYEESYKTAVHVLKRIQSIQTENNN